MYSLLKTGSLVHWWRWMSVARTAVFVLGWVAVVPDPHTDLFNAQLAEMESLE